MGKIKNLVMGKSNFNRKSDIRGKDMPDGSLTWSRGVRVLGRRPRLGTLSDAS